MKRICSCNWEGTANRNLPRVLRLNKTPFFKANSDFSFWLGDITISASRMIGQRWRSNFCRKFSSFGRNLFWSLTKSDTTWRSVSHPPGPERDASGLRERASATEFKLPLMWLIQRSNSCKNKIHWANVPVNSLFSYKYFTAELSVQTVNFELYTNGLNFLRAHTRARHFNSSDAHLLSLDVKRLQINATGRSPLSEFCERTALSPNKLASVLISVSNYS